MKTCRVQAIFTKTCFWERKIYLRYRADKQVCLYKEHWKIKTVSKVLNLNFSTDTQSDQRKILPLYYQFTIML